MGAIGIALNGVQFYGGAVERTDDDDPGCELLDAARARGANHRETTSRPRGAPGVDDPLPLLRDRPTPDLYSPRWTRPPASDYLFTFRCYRGCVWSDLVSETNRCTGAARASRTTTCPQGRGYTDKCVSAEATAYCADPARPLIDPACPLVADAQASRCADRGGECYASNHTCEAGAAASSSRTCAATARPDADEPAA
ncbi:hypothetical protein JL721_12143 [Aureococcus anophagefferens]|nr:hypothetical protein JL721_12143 [Aureococcus anophagefferens]